MIMLAAQATVCVVFFPTTRLMAPVMFVVMFYASTVAPRAAVDKAAGVTGSSAATPRRP